MMSTTEQLAKIYSISPLEVMNHDAEHVVMLINYLLEKAADKAPSGANVNNTPKAKDNFWDF